MKPEPSPELVKADPTVVRILCVTFLVLVGLVLLAALDVLGVSPPGVGD